MAHKKGMGSSRNGRDSTAQRLGVKAFHPGTNVRRAKDDSLFTTVDGLVKFEDSRGKKTVSVYPVPSNN